MMPLSQTPVGLHARPQDLRLLGRLLLPRLHRFGLYLQEGKELSLLLCSIKSQILLSKYTYLTRMGAQLIR